MKTAVLLPTFNEAQTIVEILSRLLRAGDWHVVVLDDSSPDGTADVVRGHFRDEPRVEVIARPGKEGLGAAYMAGFEEILRRGFERIVTLDADGSHAPEELSRLLERSGGSDLVIGSRYVRGGRSPGLSALRRLMSLSVNAAWRWLAGSELRDATSAMRCYRSPALREVLARRRFSSHYAFLSEIALEFLRAGYRVSEVPITYRARAGGRSKLSLRVSLDSLRVLGRNAIGERNRKPRKRKRKTMNGEPSKTEAGFERGLPRLLFLFPPAVLALILFLAASTLGDLRGEAESAENGTREEPTASAPSTESFLDRAVAETSTVEEDREALEDTPDLAATAAAYRLWRLGEREAVFGALRNPRARPGFQAQLLLYLSGEEDPEIEKIARDLLEGEWTDRRVRSICRAILEEDGVPDTTIGSP